MAYTVEQFKAEVAANGGYEALLVMYFNNSYTHAFVAGEVFNEATQLDETNGVVKFTITDLTGKKVIVTRLLAYLEGMAYAENAEERDYIDLRTVRY